MAIAYFSWIISISSSELAAQPWAMNYQNIMTYLINLGRFYGRTPLHEQVVDKL